MQHCEVEVDLAFSLVIQLEDDLGANKDIIGVIEKFVNKNIEYCVTKYAVYFGSCCFFVHFCSTPRGLTTLDVQPSVPEEIRHL